MPQGSTRPEKSVLWEMTGKTRLINAYIFDRFNPFAFFKIQHDQPTKMGNGVAKAA